MDNDIGTGVDGMTNVGNLQDGVILNGVNNNVIAYDLWSTTGTSASWARTGPTAATTSWRTTRSPSRSTE